jgi:carbamoyltransferase
MIILGIHSGHDSSAAIIKDGRVLADVQEERFNRIKHSNNVPLRSIDYCLTASGLKSINDVDYISFSWKTNPKTIDSIFGLTGNGNSKKVIAKGIAKTFFGMSLGMSNIKLPIYYPDYILIEKGKYINNDHHLVHAASAYFTRKSNDKCLVFTIDGAGDNTSTAVWFAEGNQIKL